MSFADMRLKWRLRGVKKDHFKEGRWVASTALLSRLTSVLTPDLFGKYAPACGFDTYIDLRQTTYEEYVTNLKDTVEAIKAGDYVDNLAYLELKEARSLSLDEWLVDNGQRPVPLITGLEVIRGLVTELIAALDGVDGSVKKKYYHRKTIRLTAETLELYLGLIAVRKVSEFIR